MPEARYKQVVDALAHLITSGRLRPGTRLPTHRTLAQTRGLALATASRVYSELAAMALVTGETGRGTFVRETELPAGLGVDQGAVADDVVDLNFNYPSVAGQPALLRTALRRLASSGDLDGLLRYHPHGGRRHEREMIARHAARHGLPASADSLLIVDGAQHGLAVAAMALLKPGDVVAVDALTYPGIRVLAQSLRLELVPIPAAQSGPDLDALTRLCKRRRVRAVYAQPTLHNPLGWVTPLADRRRLVAVARQFGLVLIEDAPYAFLERAAPDSLASLAPELTIHVSGFSKNVATGLRVGFVVAPLAWIPSLERAIRATTWHTPGVMTSIVCQWIEDGTVARLEAARRRDARARQAVARQALQGRPVQTHPASYFLWLPLGSGIRSDKVAHDLLTRRISVSTADPFATTSQVPHALRLALGSVGLPALGEALRVVRQVVDDHDDH